MAYRCEVYCNTGFNAVDIPDDYYTLKNNFTSWKEFDDIDLIQTEYLATLRLSEIPHEVARQVDYIVIEDPDVGPEGMKRSCYTVESFSYTSWDVVEFHLLLDAYNTFGGFKLETSGNEIISGFANRLSISLEDDVANFYTLDEPFQPAERCDTEIYKLFDPGTDTKTLIETTTVPPLVEDDPSAQYISSDDPVEIFANVGKCYAANTYGATISRIKSGGNFAYTYSKGYQPLLRNLVPTTIRISRPDGSLQQLSSATRYWDADKIEYKNKVYKQRVGGEAKDIEFSGNLVKDFHDADRDSDILNYWELPKSYAVLADDPGYDPLKETDYGGIDIASNSVKSGAQSVSLPIGNNNKAKYCQSIMVKVYSPVSGEQMDKTITDITGPNVPTATSVSCPWIITSDIRPGGTPIFLWQYIGNEAQASYLTETIKGGSWRNLTLNIQGESRTQSMANAYNMRQQGRSIDWDLVSGTVGALGTAAKAGANLYNPSKWSRAAELGIDAVGQMINTQANAYMANKKMAEDQAILNQRAANASTNIKIGDSNYARDCGLNTFFCVVSKYSANDMYSYDTFLTQYGYNVGNKRFENKDLFTRPAFNYVRINDLQVRSLSSNIDLFTKVKEQMKMGVRLWHKKPEVQDMLPGGNR